jgi:microcompartment protein CcmK/EutM
VGVGPGEYVLYATGSSARQTDSTENRPVDATIIAIVDMWEVDGEVLYQKDAPLAVAES